MMQNNAPKPGRIEVGLRARVEEAARRPRHLDPELADTDREVYVLRAYLDGGILSVHSTYELADAARVAKVKADGGFFTISNYGVDPE